MLFATKFSSNCFRKTLRSTKIGLHFIFAAVAIKITFDLPYTCNSLASATEMCAHRVALARDGKNECWISKKFYTEQYLLTRNILLAHTRDFRFEKTNGKLYHIASGFRCEHAERERGLDGWIEFTMVCSIRMKTQWLFLKSFRHWMTNRERALTGVYKLKQWTWWFHQFTLFFRNPTTKEWESEKGVHHSDGVYDGRNWQSRKA